MTRMYSAHMKGLANLTIAKVNTGSHNNEENEP